MDDFLTWLQLIEYHWPVTTGIVWTLSGGGVGFAFFKALDWAEALV